jgi:hypothetical protein
VQLDSEFTRLDAAYRSTIFKVLAEPSFNMHVGDVSLPLLAVMEKSGVSTSTFVTAWNPYSKSLSESENKDRHNQLSTQVSILNLQMVSGEGIDPSGHWPGEPSLLILGSSFRDACQLGLNFEQNAIVWVGRNAIPKLVWISQHSQIATQDVLGIGKRSDGRFRFCPNPSKWHKLHLGLVEFARLNNITEADQIPIPLILNGWSFSSPIEKQGRWQQTIEWCARNDCLELLRSLQLEDYTW